MLLTGLPYPLNRHSPCNLAVWCGYNRAQSPASPRLLIHNDFWHLCLTHLTTYFLPKAKKINPLALFSSLQTAG